MKAPLRVLLALLVLLVMAPMVAINASSISKIAESEKRHAEEILFQVLESGERSLDHLIRSSEDLLSQIVRKHSSVETFVKPFGDRYASAGIINENGIVVESFPQALSQVSVTDRLWFRRVLELKGTIIGHFLVERIAGKPGLVLARSMDKPDGAFGGAAFIVIRQEEFQKIVSGLRLPSDAVATIRDAQGLVLARSLEPEKWVGKELPEAGIFQDIEGKTAKGSLRARGIDGIERIYVYAFVGDTAERGGVYLTIGVPTERVFEPVKESIIKAVLLTIGSVGLAAIFSLLFVKLSIVEPLDELKRATEAFAEGRRIKVKPSQWPLEFTELAFAFNSMREKIIEHQCSMELMIGQIPGALYRATLDSPVSYVFVSPRVQDLVGSGVSVEGPFPWFDFIHKEDRDRVKEALKRFIEGEETVFRAEYRVVSIWGTVRWIRDEGIKTNWKGARVIQGIWRDISWRIKSEEEVALFRLAIEESPDGYAIIGEEGKILWANTSFLRMLNCSDIFSCDDMKELFATLLALDSHGISFLKAIEERREWNGRLKIFPEPAAKEMMWDVSFLSIGKESDKRFLLIRDVTQEISLQNQLFVAQKMEAIGTLATGIAHDFNNLLMIVMGYTELAMMELTENDRIRSFLEEVLQAGERAKQLISQIISFARETPREVTPLSLSTIVKENIKFLQQLMPPGINLVSKIELTPAENDTVLASPIEFQQLMMNLIVNAVQAMENRGTITVCLKKCQFDENFVTQLGPPYSEEGYLKLSVKDTGCGIDPSIVHRIFEPYFTTKPPGKGTGMGLAIVYNVVKRMKGIINVESKPGEGTIFKMIFPACRFSAEEGVKSRRISEVIEAPLSHKRPLRILVVDDDEAILRMLKLELEHKGFYVTTFSDPKDVLKRFYEAPSQFDIAVLDYQMPDMNGLELARQLFDIRLNFPVILLSGFVDEELEKQAKSEGIRAVLQKPASIEEIFAVILACEERTAHEVPLHEGL